MPLRKTTLFLFGLRSEKNIKSLWTFYFYQRVGQKCGNESTIVVFVLV